MKIACVEMLGCAQMVLAALRGEIVKTVLSMNALLVSYHSRTVLKWWQTNLDSKWYTGLTDGENCTRRDFFTGGAEEGDELVDDERFTPVRFNRERAVGASDRDFARRIHGSMESRQCEDGLTCMENTCTMREASKSL